MTNIPFKNKKRVSIFISEDKEKEFKKKAIEAGVSLSQYLEAAGTVISIPDVRKHTTYTGGAALPGEKYE